MVIMKESVAKPKWHESSLILDTVFWMLLLHKGKHPEGLLEKEISVLLGSLRPCDHTRVGTESLQADVGNPVPKCDWGQASVSRVCGEAHTHCHWWACSLSLQP